jgi:hypothetical protein
MCFCIMYCTFVNERRGVECGASELARLPLRPDAAVLVTVLYVHNELRRVRQGAGGNESRERKGGRERR